MNPFFKGPIGRQRSGRPLTGRVKCCKGINNNKMITFFRRIRKTMADDNKPIQYMRYAVGEILLVVIGILIALQINNWNEARKDQATEKQLLDALRTDFLETKARLGETILLQKSVVSCSRRLLNLYENDKLLEMRDSIGDYVGFGALSWWRAEPVTGTYDAMVSTGNIGLIKNKKLRRNLAEFDAELRSGFEDHEYSMDLLTLLTIEQSEYGFDLVRSVTREEMGLAEIKSPEKAAESLVASINELKNNKRFFGLLSSRMIMEINRLERQEKMMLFVNTILDIIDTELKK